MDEVSSFRRWRCFHAGFQSLNGTSIMESVMLMSRGLLDLYYIVSCEIFTLLSCSCDGPGKKGREFSTGLESQVLGCLFNVSGLIVVRGC